MPVGRQLLAKQPEGALRDDKRVGGVDRILRSRDGRRGDRFLADVEPGGAEGGRRKHTERRRMDHQGGVPVVECVPRSLSVII